MSAIQTLQGRTLAGATSEPIPRPLPSLERLHIICSDFWSTADDIVRLAKTRASDSPSFVGTPLIMCIHYRDAGSQQSLIQSLTKKKVPGVHFRHYRHADWKWAYVGVPMPFEMSPSPFREIRDYEVLGADGEWTPQTGPFYHIA
ncbi:hypothetical protein BDN72DRAFT_833191 [Pluteus cervinus]|uniref:Uncharacterized protein n=1 Tax=Pluteus cervinus TaxID=181527 RepID=A0ACD3B9I4_9AGAR|nr:hypothetical protein BDN72DRAFT_833191 [Pluteus cervinus]